MSIFTDGEITNRCLSNFLKFPQFMLADLGFESREFGGENVYVPYH